MPEFKDIILSLRNEKTFSQEELAKELHVSKATVGMWETGKRLPGQEKYEEIADYFNVDMDYLYGRSDVKKKFHFDKDGNEYVLNNGDSSKSYYLDDETAKTAQEIKDNDDILFEAYRSSQKERLIAYAEGLMARERQENGDDI